MKSQKLELGLGKTGIDMWLSRVEMASFWVHIIFIKIHHCQVHFQSGLEFDLVTVLDIPTKKM